MRDERVEKLADLVVNYSVNIKPGDRVAIQAGTPAEPLIKAIYTKVLQAGGNPIIMMEPEGTDEILYKYASDEQLTYVHEPIKHVIENYDVSIAIIADANTKAMTRIDPARMVKRSQAYRELNDTFMNRAAKGEVRWTVTLFPTHAHAQDAEMSLTDYEDFVYNACMPDLADPIGYWKKISAQQDKLVDWLKGKDKIHVIGPETDLHLRVDGRAFVNCDCHYNVPDGEIFTGPVEDSVEGCVYFSYPALFKGREVTGVRLWFEKGKVVKATAGKNEDFLLKTLNTDEGSRTVGEFAIGTNSGIKRFTGEILFDEKIGGSFHMALGAGYPETGSLNRSAIHWDMICDLRSGGEIWVDDQLFYQNGKFVLDLA